MWQLFSKVAITKLASISSCKLFLVGRRNANIKMHRKLICKNLYEIPFFFKYITISLFYKLGSEAFWSTIWKIVSSIEIDFFIWEHNRQTLQFFSVFHKLCLKHGQFLQFSYNSLKGFLLEILFFCTYLENFLFW